MARKTLRGFWNGLALGLTLLALLVNARFYRLPAAAYGPDAPVPDAPAQLAFIRAALEQGAGPEMQQLFPEGFFFTAALYGLAWVDLGLRAAPGSSTRQTAQAEALWALALLDSPAGRAPFAPSLDPPLGVFYVGWVSWLRGGTLALAPNDPALAAERTRFAADCAALAAAFERSPTPFLMAYPSQAWPVDSTVAMAALSRFDSLGPPTYTVLRQRWVQAAQQRLDPATGLLPHRADPRTGAPLEGARGSSQSIIARFLPAIDARWAAAQYAAFRRQFVDRLLAVPGIREYPSGSAGASDVDSGPLIAGISASATVVTLGAALAWNDRDLAAPLLATTEAVGIPWQWSGQKRYALGLLPVGDAFLVWAKTARPLVPLAPAVGLPSVTSWWWRWPFHALSLAVVALLWLPWLRRRRGIRRQRRSAQQASTSAQANYAQ